MQRLVWWNGEVIPESEAKVSIYDSAMMFGDTVFEMTRSFNKKHFKLREHLDRLYAGIKIFRLPVSMSIEDMELAVAEVTQANEPMMGPDDEHRLMINVTRGILSIYEGVVGLKTGANVIIADFPLRWTVSFMGHLFDKGINATITSQRAIPATLLDPKIKNRSRIHYLMANIEASSVSGEDNWALMLDPDGFIAEGTGDNFFIVKGGKVITPEGRNILRGISREYVFELCRGLGIPCTEKNIEPYDVYTADEAFMTGTPFCMLPVTTLNKVKIGSGTPGYFYNQILSHWSGNVGLNIKAQIQAYAKEAKPGGVTPYQFKEKEGA
jgi:branched-chain amino acid aminotransferase